MQEGMTPEQRAELRRQMAERRGAALTDEQRAELRRQVAERRCAMERGRAVGPEQRAQFEALRLAMQQLHESSQQARAAVQAVLTAEQQAQLRTLQQQRLNETRARWGESRPLREGRRGAGQRR
jgi:Spy/CpxP family protein refolding chaperone